MNGVVEVDGAVTEVPAVDQEEDKAAVGKLTVELGFMLVSL